MSFCASALPILQPTRSARACAGARRAVNFFMNAIEKVRSLVEEIRSHKNPMQVLDHWTLAGRLLSRMPVDQVEVVRAVKARDLDALDALVASLEKAPPEPIRPEPDAAVSPAEMEAALKAFKKRLKVSRLADESRLGGRYTSGGRQSKIDAMEPPREFPPAVWKALEKAGRIVHTGQGFYTLPES